MYRKRTILFSLFVMAMMVMGMMIFACPTYAATRGTDVSVPGQGNVFVKVRGTYSSAAKATILDRINAIRKEACDKGYRNPDTSRPLTSADYVPMKWSGTLEKIAQTRAAEASVVQDHVRPNGTTCFSVTYDGITSSGENLAWNYSGMKEAVEQWYSEKNDWVKGNNNAVTGHYTSLISPGFCYIGLGTFAIKGQWITTAGEFTGDGDLSQDKVGVTGDYEQVIEVCSSAVSLKLSGDKVGLGGSRKLSSDIYIAGESAFGNSTKVKGVMPVDALWTSSNTNIATVDNYGLVTGHSIGTATITVAYGGKSASAAVKVEPMYKITYYLNGGNNNSANPDMYLNQKITLKNPTRKGYTFAGWYKEKSFKNRIKSFSKGNRTVYARWSKVKVGKTQISTLKSIAGKKMKVSWKAVSKGKGYQIQYCTSKKFTVDLITLTTKSRAKTIKDVKKKQKYFVRVRAYKKDSAGEKVYGGWSKAKSVKIV